VKITEVETIPVSVPLGRTFQGSYYSMTHRATLITRVYTDEGVVGETYNGDEDTAQATIQRIINEKLVPRLVGKDPLEVEARYEDMLPATFDILSYRRLPIMAVAAIDSALWDIVGKVAGLPLATVWGGYRKEVPIIAIGGYYGQSLAELGGEIEQYRELGFAGCKVKVGGATPAEDAERFATARKAGGADFVLMADANQGYTVAEALTFCRLVAEYDLRWFEEPVRWYNDRLGMRDVRLKSGVPVCAGQTEMSRAGARDLIADGAIDVCNYDASWSGGPSEWRRVAGMAACYDVQMGHHEESQVAVHLIASTPLGTYVEAFHPDRDPVFWHIDAGRAPFRDGNLAVPDRPGLGIELDWDWVNRYRLDRERG
jgi:D-galactarolactone cycloisomerase